MPMPSLVEDLRCFVRVAECGSFSIVARENMVSQATIGRRIGGLEDHFKILLFHRSTRRIILTDAGQSFLVYARRILQEFETAENALGRHSAEPKGRVRVGSTNAFGQYLVRGLAQFSERYPCLSIDLVVGDGLVNLIEDGFDLALRIGEVTESSVVARHLGDVPRTLVAAPSYLERHGVPEDVSALQHHECVLFSYGTTKQVWNVGGSLVRVSGSFRTNSSIAQFEAVRNGVGISLFPWFQVDDDIRQGRLVRLLPDMPIEPIHFYMTYPAYRTLPPRTRVVVDWISEEARKLVPGPPPYEDSEM
ncbi:LysR family transcriptional regulator [Beijerinckia mobilis]|uniref:LysR family transcriptional regulator n=1 Tax=Beijerinckia mobilis TaxID=231434 RepID=UPI00068E5D06|nr:LysR family transcriptional regulator [Beijerinckia mobilis]